MIVVSHYDENKIRRKCLEYSDIYSSHCTFGGIAKWPTYLSIEYEQDTLYLFIFATNARNDYLTDLHLSVL